MFISCSSETNNPDVWISSSKFDDENWENAQISEPPGGVLKKSFFPPVQITKEIEPKEIVDWIMEENAPVRFQLQSHKYIWEPEKKGV